MAEPLKENLYEVEELLNQPGTYFNPQTEVVVVVDDSASLDQEVFNMEAYEGAEWVRIADEIPLDEAELLPGRGVRGDRYFAGEGEFSGRPGGGRDLTLVEAEAIEALAAEHG